MKKQVSFRKIAAARKAKGLTQQQLADAVGIHSVTMSKLENGRADLTIDLIFKISDLLDMPVSDLILSGPSARFNWDGYILRDGVVQPVKADTFSILHFTEDQFSGERHRWYGIFTDEFFPMLHNGDAIRATEIDDNLEDCYDRLCVVEKINDVKERRLGILGYGRVKSDLLLRSASGSRINVDPFNVLSVVTMTYLRLISLRSNPERLREQLGDLAEKLKDGLT